MNLKLRVVSMAAVFFTGSLLMAQRTPRAKKDTITEKTIDEVVVTGYRTTTKKKAVTTVTTINSETIENRPNANVLSTLQGQAAGVNISSGSGQPGQKPTVIIRGVGTYSGNSDPLYVIDGFPSNSDSFRSINPNDIETLSVLKDASAISEYGSRGSNGVILIKTKGGRFNQKLSLRYSSNYGVSTLQDPKYKFANSVEMLTLEKRYGVGLGSTLTQAAIDAYPINTNWRKVFFRPAITQSHDLAISSGGENINSYTSVGYYTQEGILRTTGLKRFTVRNNISGRSNDKKFSYSLNSGLGFSKNNLATNLGTGAINRNYITGAYISAPYVSSNLYQSGNGQQVLDLYRANGTLLYTPLFLQDKLVNYSNLTDELRLDMSGSASYKLTNDLTASVRASGQYLNTTFFQAEYPQSFNALLFLGSHQFGGFEDNNVRREFLFNNLYSLKYEKQLGKHSFSLQANGEYNYSEFNALNVRRNGLIPKTYVPGSGSGYAADTSANDFYVPQTTYAKLKLNMISYFASFDYDYDGKFGLLLTGRNDATSRFAKDKQNTNFWAAGARINLESFLNSSKIQMLKLHGSIGTAGNQRVLDGTVYAGINPPLYQDVYALGNNVYNSQQGYSVSTFGFPDLRWETTKNIDLAIDFDLFRRLSGTFGVYKKRTYDLYLPEPQSPVLGGTSIFKNSDAFIINKGIEADLKYYVIKNENMQFSIRGNGSYNDGKIDGIKTGEIKGDITTTKNGHLLGEYKLYKYAGVNQANGNLLFYDINGKTTETPKDSDRQLTGKNSLPKYQGGFGFDFKYKGFFASTSFSFVADLWRFDYDLAGYLDPTNLGTFAVTKDLLNAWTPTNTNTNIPSLTAANTGFQTYSDRFLRDASYLRLRNVQIGYELPKAFLTGTPITNVSLTLQAENLVTFTKWQGFDAESNRAADQYQYPTPKIYTFGIDVKF